MKKSYCYPGTQVLRNKLGIRDFDVLSELERETVRFKTMNVHDIRGNFDAKHIKAVHKHLFGDIYPWAGKFRTGDIWKDGSSFCHYWHIESELKKWHAGVVADGFMCEITDKSDVVEHLEQHFAVLDRIHPFREGNGRMERVMIGMLANNAGYHFDISGVSREDWIRASKLATYGTHFPMQNIFDSALKPVDGYDVSKRRLPLIATSDFGVDKSDDYECE